jgi:hypothetical protein
MKDSHLTLRIPAELARTLARRAKALGIPKSQMAREAVVRYLVPAIDEETTTPDVSARTFAARWRAMPRLEPSDAKDFAADLDESRNAVPPIRSPWE